MKHMLYSALNIINGYILIESNADDFAFLLAHVLFNIGMR